MENQMKHKLMLGLGLSLLLSANSFAMEIHGGKLIGHKEWTKGNVIKSSFKDIKLSDAIKHPAFRLHQKEFPSWVYAYGVAYGFFNNSVPVNTDTQVGGRSVVRINNNDTVQKTYTITTTLYVESPLPTSTCPDASTLCPIIIPVQASSTQDIVILDPEGSIETDRNPMLTTSFANAGTASYWIENQVNVNDSSIVFNAPSNAEFIQITDAKK